MIQAEKPPLTFDELMSTPIDFSTFGINRLKLNKITRADLVGPVFNLLKGTCKSCVELEYNMEECYRALIDQLDWTTPEGHKSPVDMSKPLPLQGNSERKHSSSITKTPIAKGPKRQQFYRAMINKVSKHEVFSTVRMLSVDLHLNDIEDMLLLIAQNKLFNLEGDVIMDFVTALKIFTRRIIVQNRVEDVQLEVIYVDKSKKKRELMRVADDT
ncbi:hypothetical protein Tco_0051599 [Tanacetum coccineum]